MMIMRWWDVRGWGEGRGSLREWEKVGKGVRGGRGRGLRERMKLV